MAGARRAAERRAVSANSLKASAAPISRDTDLLVARLSPCFLAPQIVRRFE
jgi:hypothetical protein